jgi:hypothetical protein
MGSDPQDRPLISPTHFEEQIAPTSVGKGGNQPDLHVAYGFVVANGIVQNPSINGYSGAFGYNLQRRDHRGRGHQERDRHDRRVRLRHSREVTKYVTPVTPINF